MVTVQRIEHRGIDAGLALQCIEGTVAGIAFIASVVVCATLMMLEKPNDPGLGEGSGVNRSSAKLYAQRRAQRRSTQAGPASGQPGSAASADTTSPEARDHDGGPEFGKRVHPEQ